MEFRDSGFDSESLNLTVASSNFFFLRAVSFALGSTLPVKVGLGLGLVEGSLVGLVVSPGPSFAVVSGWVWLGTICGPTLPFEVVQAW